MVRAAHRCQISHYLLIVSLRLTPPQRDPMQTVSYRSRPFDDNHHVILITFGRNVPAYQQRPKACHLKPSLVEASPADCSAPRSSCASSFHGGLLFAPYRAAGAAGSGDILKLWTCTLPRLHVIVNLDDKRQVVGHVIRVHQLRAALFERPPGRA